MVFLTEEIQTLARGRTAEGIAQLSQEQAAFAQGGPTAPEVLVAAAGSGKTETLLARFGWCLRNSPLGTLIQIISFTNAAADNFQARFERTWGKQPWRVARTLHSWAKSDLLKAYFTPEERVSLIIPRAIGHLRRWELAAARKFSERLVLLVDEAQDCGPEQMELLQILRGLGAAVALVGDPRQTIFGWQGADPAAMLRLGWRQARLATNRRSDESIVKLANVIAASATDLCRDTGLGDEGRQPQHWLPGNAGGTTCTIRHVKNIQYDSLRAAYEELLTAPRTAPACVLAYRNSSVDVLHQNLAVLGYETLALLASEGREEPGGLKKEHAAATGDPSLVHVRTVHDAKGEGYDTVVLHVDGFRTAAEARDAFAALPLSQRQEELRRYYVACTRARHAFHVIVSGPCAPVWWQEIEETACALGVLVRVGATLEEGVPSQRPPENADISVSKMCSKHHACDCLLTHAPRAQTRLLAEVNDRGLYAPGCTASLADGHLALEAEALDAPQRRLQELRATRLHATAVRFAFVCSFAPERARERVQDAVRFMSKVPLHPRHLDDVRRLGEVASSPGFYALLAGALAQYLRGSCSLSLVTGVFTTPQRKLSGTAEGNPNYALIGGAAFKDLINQRPGYPFLLGRTGQATLETVIARLQALSETDAPECDDLFRARVTILDAETLLPAREELLLGALRFLEGDNTARAVGCAALLSEFSRTQHKLEEGAHRALPYLGAAAPHRRLSVGSDCLLSPPSFRKCLEQARALRTALEKWHTARELAALEACHWACGEPEGAPGRLTGQVDLFIQSEAPLERVATCVFLAAGAQVSLEEETKALVTAGLALPHSAHRVLILETASAILHRYDVAAGENAPFAASRCWVSQSLPLAATLDCRKSENSA